MGREGGWQHDRRPFNAGQPSPQGARMGQGVGQGRRPVSTRQARRPVINEPNGWQMVVSRRGGANPKEDIRTGVINAKERTSEVWGRGGKQNQGIRGFRSEANEKAYAKDFNECRCLRCLSKDHKRAQCREPVRCFKCGKMGHYYSRCKTEDKEVITVQKPVPQGAIRVTKACTFASLLKDKEKEKPPVVRGKEKEKPPVVREQQDPNQNKKEMELFWDVRPKTTNIYLPH